MGYKIASGVAVLLLAGTWYAAFTGWGLPTTTVVEAQRQAITQRHSVRIGYSGGGGPRYGK